MTQNKYYPYQPIILGLAGKAATGKTSVAETIVPKAQLNYTQSPIIWDHIFFALPLYEMASIKKNTKGFREQTRQLFSLHSVLYDVFGGSSIGNVPDYDELIDIVKTVYNTPLDPNGSKPRSFLQKTGDLCRKHDENCFATWAISKSLKIYREFLNSVAIDEDPKPFGVIISDVRFANEAEAILKQPNGIVICYEASDDVRDQRIMDRDGVHMSNEQKNHISEQQIDIVKDMASVVINTDNLSIKDQTDKTLEYVNNFIGMYAENN